MMIRASLCALVLALAASIGGCGPSIDRQGTLDRLRAALTAPITGTTVLEDHNQLVENVVQNGLLERMRQHEVEELLGRGQECGSSDICARHDFAPNDYIYEVGRDPNDPSLPAGPTLLVGFDRQGVCDRTFYLTRR